VLVFVVDVYFMMCSHKWSFHPSIAMHATYAANKKKYVTDAMNATKVQYATNAADATVKMQPR